MSTRERIAVACALAISLLLRIVAFFNYRFDSDEQQHLHVAWGWTAGLVQYRDLFDNHTPLFHILSAPLVALIGERSDILFFMRAAMLPLFGVVVVCTFVLARRLYSTRVALWSVVVLCLFPTFFLKSLEYRNDNLWAALSVMALLLAATFPRTNFVALTVGVLVGLALAVSIKTVLLIIALIGAAIILRDFDWRHFGWAALGFFLPNVILAIYFAAAGAWDDLVYCVVEFNSGLTEARSYSWIPRLLYPVALAGIVVAARKVSDRRRAFLGVTVAIFIATLLCLWILVSPRDVLAVMPALVIFLVAAVDRLPARVPALIVITLVTTAALWRYADGFANRTRIFTTMIDQVIGLTRVSEPLMDIKGETLFRRRPFYHAFEIVTRAQMAKGMIADRVPEAIIAARCYVTQAEGPMFPARANAFVHDYFVDLGRLRAAGQFLRADGSFTIAVPGPYVVITASGEARGTLDGTRYSGERYLSAGEHRFESEVGGTLVALWSPAFKRGYSPFHKRDIP